MKLNEMLFKEGMTAGEMLEKQKGFAYELKKKNDKYYIYYLGKNKKAYSKGIKELSNLKDIIEPWLKNTSLTFNNWGKRIQSRLIAKHIQKLKNTLEE